MRQIWIGIIFTFLNFDLNFGSVKVGLIPAFVGFFFIVKGLDELSVRYPGFSSIRPFAVGMGIYTAVLYALDLLTLSARLGYFLVPFGVIASVISLYISYAIIREIAVIEQDRGVELYSKTLKTIWIFRAVFELCSYAYVLFTPIAIVCTVAGFIVSCCYLVVFRKTVLLYEAMPEPILSESTQQPDCGESF